MGVLRENEAVMTWQDAGRMAVVREYGRMTAASVEVAGEAPGKSGWCIHTTTHTRTHTRARWPYAPHLLLHAAHIFLPSPIYPRREGDVQTTHCCFWGDGDGSHRAGVAWEWYAGGSW